MTTPASTLTLELTSFRRLFGLVAALHLLAGASLLLLDIGWHWRLLAWLVLAAYAAFLWYDTRWTRRLRRLRFVSGETGVEFIDRDRSVPIGAGVLVTPWLIILPLQVGGRHRWLPLLSGCCAAEDLRRLRVLLRCYGSGRGSGRTTSG